METRGSWVRAGLCALAGVTVVSVSLILSTTDEASRSPSGRPPTSSRADSTDSPTTQASQAAHELDAAPPSVSPAPSVGAAQDDPAEGLAPTTSVSPDSTLERLRSQWNAMRRNPRSPEESRDRLAEGPLPTEVPPVLWDITSPVPRVRGSWLEGGGGFQRVG